MSAAALEILDKIKHLSQEENDLLMEQIENLFTPSDPDYEAQRDPQKVKAAIEAAENGSSEGIIVSMDELWAMTHPKSAN